MHQNEESGHASFELMSDRVLERAPRANNLTRGASRRRVSYFESTYETAQPRSDPEGDVTAGC